MGANMEETASGNNDAWKNGSESNAWLVTIGKKTQKRKLSACTNGADSNIEQS